MIKNIREILLNNANSDTSVSMKVYEIKQNEERIADLLQITGLPRLKQLSVSILLY